MNGVNARLTAGLFFIPSVPVTQQFLKIISHGITKIYTFIWAAFWYGFSKIVLYMVNRFGIFLPNGVRSPATAGGGYGVMDA